MHKLADGLVMCSFCKSLFPLSRLSPKPVWIFFPYLGPSNWSGICSTGKRQSPIDIKSTEVTFDKGLGEFTLKNYDRKLNKTFTGSNTGYAFGLSFPAGVYNVSGGGLNGVYTTVQFHLHYGPNDTVGSEHIVDGEHYAAEVSACEQISAFTCSSLCPFVIKHFLSTVYLLCHFVSICCPYKHLERLCSSFIDFRVLIRNNYHSVSRQWYLFPQQSRTMIMIQRDLSSRFLA